MEKLLLHFHPIWNMYDGYLFKWKLIVEHTRNDKKQSSKMDNKCYTFMGHRQQAFLKFLLRKWRLWTISNDLDSTFYMTIKALSGSKKKLCKIQYNSISYSCSCHIDETFWLGSKIITQTHMTLAQNIKPCIFPPPI